MYTWIFVYNAVLQEVFEVIFGWGWRFGGKIWGEDLGGKSCIHVFLYTDRNYIFENVRGRRKSVVLKRESIGRAYLNGVILSLLCRRFFIIVILLLVPLFSVTLSVVMLSLCRPASREFISALFWVLFLTLFRFYFQFYF